MSRSTRPVFLSYASQDAAPALRICDALRGAEVDVWFDQSALRGGDVWDALIRRQIKECALFVPIISANTESRAEGYFRLEWKLAVDRSHLMAEDRTFLLPVVVDETMDAKARVPEKFREVQWTHLPGGNGAAAFAARVLKLLAGDDAALPAGPARGVSGAAAPATELPSIAVLPLVNMSRDEENEYFADGLSEELLNVLAKIRGLRVVSRTSAFSFKGKAVDIPAVAQKLNVATVLEGSVRRAGKRVRITVQLIEVATDSHLWSETYDRELDDIFAVQDDIAQSVVTELRGTLLGEHRGAGGGRSVEADVRRAAAGRSDDPEAFQLYLQGKFFGERATQADTDKAIELFRRALAIDPKFSLAWAELSRVHQTQAGFGFASIDAGFERAREAANEALRLTPDLAEGHVVLGQVHAVHDWNWPAADASFRRALELAPGDAQTLAAMAELDGILGRADASLARMRQVLTLDPLSAPAHRRMALACWRADRLDDAAAAFEYAIDLNPKSGPTHAFLAIVRLYQGRSDEALALAQAEAHDVFRNLAIAVIQHARQRPTESAAALRTLAEQWGWTAAYQVAEAHAYRQEIDRAFEWLEKAYAQRDPGVTHSATDPSLRPLHDDPRWRPFVRRLGFE